MDKHLCFTKLEKNLSQWNKVCRKLKGQNTETVLEFVKNLLKFLR